MFSITRPLRYLLAATLLLSGLPARAQDGTLAPLPDTTRLLRFPTTNGDSIVFAYAGELYTVARTGGTARRLTSGPGYSSFPRFSADGTQLAYTSQYDGNTEVYVMPADGGVPKRLTITATLGRDDISDRMGPNNIVMTWLNTKPEVVFRSRMKSFNDFIGQLYAVGMDAELPKQLPVPRGGFISFSPDDTKMAYNRVFREFRTWKRYRGGMADDILDLRFQNRHDRKPHGQSRAGHLPHVGAGQQNLLRLGPRQPSESLFHRPRHEGDETTHRVQGFRREVPLNGQGCHRVRAGGLHLAL